LQLLYSTRDSHVVRQGFSDLAAGMKDSAMVPAAEMTANLFERQVGKLPRQVHANLARHQDVSVTASGLQVPRVDPEVTSYLLRDAFHGQSVCLNQLLKMTGYRSHVQGLIM
jgi:hypothetical protein